MKSLTTRPYTGPGFILTAVAAHEIGEPHLRMSAPPRAAASAAPAKRTKAPDLNPGKFYAMRRQAVQDAALTERTEPENVFTASGAEAIYNTRRHS